MTSTSPSSSKSWKKYLRVEFNEVFRPRSTSPRPPTKSPYTYIHSGPHQARLDGDSPIVGQESTKPVIIPTPPISELADAASSNNRVSLSSGQLQPVQAAKQVGTSTLKIALGALHQSSKLFPPLQSAVEVIISGLDDLYLDVSLRTLARVNQ